jgi:ABC-type nitrate/sulfonate/bicarbonate transport system substrate-binding protein
MAVRAERWPRYGIGISYVGAALFLLLTPLLSLHGHAGERPAERSGEALRIVYAGLSGNQAPGWAAYEGGFFRKHGLDIELVNVVGGATAVQTFLSGDVQFAQVSGLPVLESAACRARAS